MLWISFLLALPAVAGEPHEAVSSLLDKARPDKARDKCDKLGAADVRTADLQPLRDVCATAWFEVAAAQKTSAAYRDFRKIWVGTPKAEEAYRLEAALGLVELGDTASEADFLAHAEKYAKVEQVASDARGMGLVAAFRDVTSDRDALEVVNRYPHAEQVNDVLLAHLEPFVVFGREEDGMKATFRAVVLLGANLPEPTLHWAVRKDGGEVVLFKDAVGAWGQQAGLSEAWLDAVAVQPFGFEAEIPMIEVDLDGAKILRRRNPEYPLCWGEGLGAVGAEVTLGTGRAFHATPWRTDCGPDADRALMLADASGFVGLKGPDGSWVDLTGGTPLYAPEAVGNTGAGGEGRVTTTLSGLPAGLGPRPSAHRAAPGTLWAKTDGGWRVTDLDSLSRWFTTATPPDTAIEVPGNLGQPLSAEAASAAGVDGVEAQSAWRIAPLLLHLLGWDALFVDEARKEALESLVATGDGAPRLSIDRWTAKGAVDFAAEPPKGAKALAVTPVQTAGPDAELAALLGLPGLVVEKEWQVDLDGLEGPEKVRLVVVPDATGAAVEAPAEGGSETPAEGGDVVAKPIAGQRMVVVSASMKAVELVWPLDLDDTAAREAPFAFELDGQRYVAWTARTTGQVEYPFLEVVRPVAGGYALDTFARPFTLGR